ALVRRPRLEVVRAHGGAEAGLLGVPDVAQQLLGRDLLVGGVEADRRHGGPPVEGGNRTEGSGQRDQDRGIRTEGTSIGNRTVSGWGRAWRPGSSVRRPEVLGGGADVAQLADALDLRDDLLAVAQPDPAGPLGQTHAGRGAAGHEVPGLEGQEPAEV